MLARCRWRRYRSRRRRWGRPRRRRSTSPATASAATWRRRHRRPLGGTAPQVARTWKSWRQSWGSKLSISKEDHAFSLLVGTRSSRNLLTELKIKRHFNYLNVRRRPSLQGSFHYHVKYLQATVGTQILILKCSWFSRSETKCVFQSNPFGPPQSWEWCSHIKTDNIVILFVPRLLFPGRPY